MSAHDCGWVMTEFVEDKHYYSMNYCGAIQNTCASWGGEIGEIAKLVTLVTGVQMLSLL